MMRALLLSSLLLLTGGSAAQVPYLPLTDAPVAIIWDKLPPPPAPESVTVVGKYPAIVASIVGDSLRVTVSWGHPIDGLGIEDSTVFRIRATRTLRFMGGGSVAPETWRRRKWLTATTADTFKLLKPAIGDSVLFSADSITQCRKGACGVPGSAGWGYFRNAAPPAMTFIKVSVDSF